MFFTKKIFFPKNFAKIFFWSGKYFFRENIFLGENPVFCRDFHGCHGNHPKIMVFKTGSVLLRLVQNWNSLLQKWILRPPTEPSRRPPPAAPSCVVSPIKMAEKAAAATSIAKWLLKKSSLSGKKRRGRRRSTPGMAGTCIKSAFLAPGAGSSQESMQKTQFSTPPLAPLSSRGCKLGDCIPY